MLMLLVFPAGCDGKVDITQEQDAGMIRSTDRHISFWTSGNCTSISLDSLSLTIWGLPELRLNRRGYLSTAANGEVYFRVQGADKLYEIVGRTYCW